MASVCVFCGARTGNHPAYLQSARELGESLVQNGHTLVYGGGSTGVMGAIADAVLAHNGHIIGVIPKHLARVELMHADVQDMRITTDMHERKSLMHRLSDVYIALPGGYGTMEELFEAITWAQLELHSRPIAVLNVQGIYDGLIQMINTMQFNGFLSSDCRNLVTVVKTVNELTTWLVTATSGLPKE